MSNPEFINRVVLITGAAKGIGAAITRAIARAGHSVAAVDCDRAALKQLCEEPGLQKVFPIVADLTAEDACNRSVNGAISQYGHVDALINNVGIGVSWIRPDAEKNHPTIEEITTEIWDHFFAINVRAAMLITRAALPYMKARKWGRIINNTTSYRTMLRVLPYGATKSALEAMSAIWAAELKGSGITVNVLVPGGATDTALIADGSGWPRSELLRPEIMGPPACWLISDEADKFTGRRLTAVDWNIALPSSEAAKTASRPIGWPELAKPPKEWQK